MAAFDNDMNEIYLFHTNPANDSPLLTEDQYYQLCDYEAQHAGEMEAENAWLRHAERKTNEDYAFEQWEQQRGCF
jgi:hypothetical protein